MPPTRRPCSRRRWSSRSTSRARPRPAATRCRCRRRAGTGRSGGSAWSDTFARGAARRAPTSASSAQTRRNIVDSSFVVTVVLSDGAARALERVLAKPRTGLHDLARQRTADQRLDARARRRSARRGRRRCRSPTPRAGRPGPRCRCCRSRRARTDSRRAPRSTTRTRGCRARGRRMTLARPTPRVLWKCSAIRMRGKAVARSPRTRRVDRRRRRHAGRVAERQAVDAERRVGVDDAQRRVDRDLAFERAAERARDGAAQRRACRARSPRLPRRSPSDPAIDALRLAWLCVSLAETKHTISSTPAPSARSAPRALGASAAMWASARGACSAQHLVRIGELRHRARADERRRLDVAHAGGDQGIDDLGLDLGRNEVGLGLEAVARADLGDRDSRTFVGGLVKFIVLQSVAQVMAIGA